ncbi:predicted protein [Naegleria gruberi]|uniref:Predicted protein n=1 Tax=Naegleria gruberi TaxID=5762 RepID=D2VR45_NAEGR|nr:uncharacterized protein NAEGRDRAFT_80937 [Naegleria gruberi]EFC40743.1 predicted protein [Naegleria gruberi]|eukprot:XP_002673487.1 predicted protein [Naegleria gruberi strain NEG-M]
MSQDLLLPEIVFQCLTYIDLATLPTCMVVCREWHDMINHSPMLWRLLFDQYSEQLSTNPRQVFATFMNLPTTSEEENSLQVKFEETFRKKGLLNDEKLLRSLKLDDNQAKHELGMLIGRIYAHCWHVHLLEEHPPTKYLDTLLFCAGRIGNFQLYEIVRLLGLTQKCYQLFNISYNYEKIETLRPLFSLSYFCNIATMLVREVEAKKDNYTQTLQTIVGWENFMVKYFEEGNNIILPENLFESDSFQRMVFDSFDDMIRFKVIRKVFGSKWPSGEEVNNILFSVFLNKLNQRFMENKVKPNDLVSNIDQCIEIFNIEKCSHEPFIQLIEGRWYGQIVNLFNSYKHLLDVKHVKRLFQSAFVATDYPDLIKYLVTEYDIDPLEFFDERNIIAQYFERLLENNDYSLRYIMDPLLCGRKMNLAEFCTKCQENNYPNLSSVEKVFNIMELLAKSCPSYAFVALMSTLNNLFEPQIIVNHSIIFERLLEFYNEGKAQLSAYEELLYNTQIVSNYSGIKYQSLKEMMIQEREYNPLFSEVLELCEKYINEKKQTEQN